MLLALFVVGDPLVGLVVGGAFGLTRALPVALRFPWLGPSARPAYDFPLQQLIGLWPLLHSSALFALAVIVVGHGASIVE
jgi:hypothetical protein